MLDYSACPSCGKEDELSFCHNCTCNDQYKGQFYRELLNKVTETKAGFNAYFPNGCLICKDCKEIWSKENYYCPLAIFYDKGFHGHLFVYYLENSENGLAQCLNDSLQELHSYLWIKSKPDTISFRKKLYQNSLERFLVDINDNEKYKQMKEILIQNGKVVRLLR